MRTSFDDPITVETAVFPDDEMKKCPFCAELIQAEAIKCRYCGEFLDGKGVPSAPKPSGKWHQSTAATVLAMLTLGPLALPMLWTNPRYSLVVKTVVTVGMIALTILLCLAVVGMYRYIINQVQALGI